MSRFDNSVLAWFGPPRSLPADNQHSDCAPRRGYGREPPRRDAPEGTDDSRAPRPQRAGRGHRLRLEPSGPTPAVEAQGEGAVWPGHNGDDGHVHAEAPGADDGLEMRPPSAVSGRRVTESVSSGAPARPGRARGRRTCPAGPGLNVIAEVPGRGPGARAGHHCVRRSGLGTTTAATAHSPPMAPASSGSPCRTRCSFSVMPSGRRARAICPPPGVGLCQVAPRGRRVSQVGRRIGRAAPASSKAHPTRRSGRGARRPGRRHGPSKRGVDGRVADHAGRQGEREAVRDAEGLPDLRGHIASLSDLVYVGGGG